MTEPQTLGVILESHKRWVMNSQGDGNRLVYASLGEQEQALFANGDFSNTWLNHANLEGADLSRSVFTGADISMAFVENADFTGANLTGALMADLRGIDSATWVGARLPEPVTADHILDLYGRANCTPVAAQTLAESHNESLEAIAAVQQQQEAAALAEVLQAHVEWSSRRGKKPGDWDGRLRASKLAPEIKGLFAGANLQGADLRGSALRRVNFAGADLSGTNLSFAIVTRSDFTGANLRDAVLMGLIGGEAATWVGATLPEPLTVEGIRERWGEHITPQTAGFLAKLHNAALDKVAAAQEQQEAEAAIAMQAESGNLTGLGSEGNAHHH